MISLICLTWIGTQLNAPTWYFGLLIFGGVLQILQFGLRMFKAGNKQEGEEMNAG